MRWKTEKLDISTSAAAVLTATVASRIGHLSVANYSGGDEALSAYIVPAAGSAATTNALYYERDVPAGATLQLPAVFNAALSVGATLQLRASTNSTLTALAGMVETSGGLLQQTVLTTSAADVTTTSNSTRVVRQISVCNVTGTSRTCALYLGGSADTDIVINEITVPAHDTVILNPALNAAVYAADTLKALASANSALTLTMTTLAV